VGTLTIIAVTLGLDSARAAAALALHPAAAKRRLLYAVASGVFDASATLVGFVVGERVVAVLEPHLTTASTLLLAAYGVCLLLDIFEWTTHGGPWMPATLCVDNLGAGAALAGSLPVLPVTVMLGLTSFALAGVGFWAGDVVRKRIPGLAARLSGAALVAIAVLQMTGLA
jgi:putative Mn2+ efflux pump MntP